MPGFMPRDHRFASAAKSDGTDVVEFNELAASDPVPLTGFLSRAGFSAVARHCFKDVTLCLQRQINLLVNADLPSLARSGVNLRAPSLCAIAIHRALPRAVQFQRRVGQHRC
jgi:4-hydroxyphenylpyruvate dioxygenase-like putative hemolysin